MSTNVRLLMLLLDKLSRVQLLGKSLLRRITHPFGANLSTKPDMAPGPVVQLAPGSSARGMIRHVRGSTTPVHTYLGLPYAQPPVGRLRFKPPHTLKLWDGIKDATEFGNVCPQPLAVSEMAFPRYPAPDRPSEDCLYLNVFTPAHESLNSERGQRSAPPADKLPVMIWIHGGGFLLGSSDIYDGSALAARHNVLVVTINYRMGIFGFLATPDGHIGGNMGLMDQVEAMKWVQKYIHNFGGDPDNVTLFGESAGSISISLHMVSPMARGLFHRAVCESGVLFYPGSIWGQKNNEKFLRSALKPLGMKSVVGKEVEEFLGKLSTDELSTHFTKMFGRVVDGQYLTADPIELYKRGQFHPVDLLCGFNTHEGYLFFKMFGGGRPDGALAFLNMSLRQLYFRGNPAVEELTQTVLDLYVNDLEDDVGVDRLAERCVDAYSHCQFVAPTVMAAEIHSARARVFMYEFRHRPDFSQLPAAYTSDHTDEIPYVFGEPFLRPEPWPQVDQRVSSTVMTYWTNFAKYGDPNDTGHSHWPRYTTTSKEYLCLSDSPEVSTNYQPRQMALWNDKILPRTQIFPDSKL